MDELVDRVATAAGLQTDQARRAVVAILAFLKQHAPTEFEDLQAHLPGVEPAISAEQGDEPPAGGGAMSGLMNMFGGGNGLMRLASQLTGIGLSTGEMSRVGQELFAVAREKAGDARVERVARAIPGLAQLL